ncbi:MAG: hypothetical protein MK135_17420 [Polyangiaceae bacterium]|nr:hypothetical protein [Polyangiaceae bacterium]
MTFHDIIAILLVSTTVACGSTPATPSTPQASQATSQQATKTSEPEVAMSPYMPPQGEHGPSHVKGFPSYAAHEDETVDAIGGASDEERDAFCKSYCSEELGWSLADYKKSSLANFFQTPESVNVRCDFSAVENDIGGAEQHLGNWIINQCKKRDRSKCYWSINYAPPHQGRVACVRAVFAE